MAARLIYVLVTSFLMYDNVSGAYCQSEDKPNIPFCRNGTISGLKVYINGSSVKTKEDLIERGCVCYLEHAGNNEITVDAKESCKFCGLRVMVGNSYLSSVYYNLQIRGWGSITLNDTKFAMTLREDATKDSLSTAFCITIQENRPDVHTVLNLTCEELMVNNTSSNASSASPNVITPSSNTVPDTTKIQSSMSAETSKPLTKTETTRIAEVTTGDRNVIQDQNINNTFTVTTKTTTANNPGELRSNTQNDVIIPAAAGGGAGVLVILVILIVVCYLRKKGQDAEKPIYMDELKTSDAIMTENTAYGISIDTSTNSVPHIRAQCTGDVYAVVNKEGNSNLLPSDEVSHVQVGEAGYVYAIVNKENVQEIKCAKSLVQLT